MQTWRIHGDPPSGMCDDAAVRSLTVWAHSDLPPLDTENVVLWQAFLPTDPPPTWLSLPAEVHRDQERLRSQYLAWLHDVGVTEEQGPTLVDHMVIRPGLSYWWMTIPADYSLEPNSPAYVATRMMALASLADRLKATHINITGANRSTSQLLKQWSKSSGRLVSVIPQETRDRTGSARERLYRTVPPLGALRVLLAHLSLRRRAKSTATVSQTEGITFVDYLAHLGPDAATEGRFDSNYWGPLVDVLDETDEPVHWLHISADLASGKVVDRDSELVRRFNGNATKQTHGLLHEHLTWGVLARSCRDYLRVCNYGIRVRHRAQIFTDSQSRVPLWQAFRATYRDQFFGRTAMLNCIWINLFHETLAIRPHQRLGFYLFENQPWEMAFITSWRAAGHGELIGVAHSTTRFWDTRYFKDPRDMWSSEGGNPMPWPDRVAVNGPAMRTQCLGAGYPANRIVDVEALRYLDIQQELPPPLPDGPIRILVCGEYSPDAAQRMLDVVNQALDIIDIPTTATYRPHPAYVGPQVRLHPSIQFDNSASVREAIGAADVVVTGVMSSVSVEAVCSGRMTLISVDSDAFITSQVESSANAMFVTSPDSLSTAIAHSSGKVQQASVNARAVYTTDNALKSWQRALLSVSNQTPEDSQTAFRSAATPAQNRTMGDPGRLT